MPVTTIYLSTTNGRVGSHLVWGDDFYRFFELSYCFWFFRLFFMIFVFLGYYTTFCLVLYISLNVTNLSGNEGMADLPTLPGS